MINNIVVIIIITTATPKTGCGLLPEVILFQRGSNNSALTKEVLVVYPDNRLWEVVAYKRWSHVEIQL